MDSLFPSNFTDFIFANKKNRREQYYVDAFPKNVQLPQPFKQFLLDKASNLFEQ
jgi:hypothetical protein